MKGFHLISGSWNIIKGKLLQTYAQLTDDDLAFVQGKEDELIGKLQSKLNLSEAEVYQLIEQYDQELKSNEEP